MDSISIIPCMSWKPVLFSFYNLIFPFYGGRGESTELAEKVPLPYTELFPGRLCQTLRFLREIYRRAKPRILTWNISKGGHACFRWNISAFPASLSPCLSSLCVCQVEPLRLLARSEWRGTYNTFQRKSALNNLFLCSINPGIFFSRLNSPQPLIYLVCRQVCHLILEAIFSTHTEGFSSD